MGEILGIITAVAVLFAVTTVIIGLVKLIVEILIVEPIIDIVNFTVSITKKISSSKEEGISLYDLYKDVEEGDYSYEFICR